jgi:hypothetical protein
MASRGQDIVDILDKADPSGWITPPTKPRLILEDSNNTAFGYIRNPPESAGVIVVKKAYSFDVTKLSNTYENQVYTFKICIVSLSDANLELMRLQAMEVFDRYTNAPWSTATNSNTYTMARLITGSTVKDMGSWVCDCTVQLSNLFMSTVIA